MAPILRVNGNALATAIAPARWISNAKSSNKDETNLGESGDGPSVEGKKGGNFVLWVKTHMNNKEAVSSP